MKRGTEGVAEEVGQMVGGVALFSDVSPTSGSRPLPHSCALQTGLGILAELETAEPAHVPSGPGISPDTHITLRFAFSFLGHSFSCAMRVMADEDT